MVPRKIGEELRRRRLTLRMKQADVARQIGTTRAYVSAVERGVDWDPDADKLVLWARALGWEDDHILRRMGRVSTPADGVANLPPEVLAALQATIIESIRLAMADILRELREDAFDLDESEPDDDRVGLAN